MAKVRPAPIGKVIYGNDPTAIDEFHKLWARLIVQKWRKKITGG